MRSLHRRSLTAALGLCLALGLTACGGGDGEKDSGFPSFGVTDNPDQGTDEGSDDGSDEPSTDLTVNGFRGVYPGQPTYQAASELGVEYESTDCGGAIDDPVQFISSDSDTPYIVGDTLRPDTVVDIGFYYEKQPQMTGPDVSFDDTVADITERFGEPEGQADIILYWVIPRDNGWYQYIRADAGPGTVTAFGLSVDRDSAEGAATNQGGCF